MRDIENQKRLKREWYHRHRQAVLDQQKERRQKIRDWYTDYKSRLSCKQCGFDHPAALEFHHLDEDDKDREINKLVGAHCCIETILAEIKKCDVLCANCHRVLHYERARSSGEEQPPSGSDAPIT